MKIENRQQFLVIAAATLIGLFLFDRVILGPVTKGWKDRSARIADLEKSIREGNATLKRANAVQNRWSEMKTNSLALADAEPKLYEAFQRWSRSANISLSGIQPTWKRGEDYMTLECHANATGSIGAIAQFLYNLETDPMALRIESMEVTARDENGRTLALGLQVSGLVLGVPAQ